MNLWLFSSRLIPLKLCISSYWLLCGVDILIVVLLLCITDFCCHSPAIANNASTYNLFLTPSKREEYFKNFMTFITNFCWTVHVYITLTALSMFSSHTYSSGYGHVLAVRQASWDDAQICTTADITLLNIILTLVLFLSHRSMVGQSCGHMRVCMYICVLRPDSQPLHDSELATCFLRPQ